MIKRSFNICRSFFISSTKSQRQTQQLYYVSAFSLFGRKKKSYFEKKDDRLSIMNQQYQEFLKEKRYNIRSAYDKNFYITETERKKKLAEAEKHLSDYLASYKFNQKFQEDNFIALLSRISYTVENKSILEKKEFLDLIKERAERLFEFNDHIAVCLFLSFCAIQNFNIPEIWPCFQSFILNNYKKFSFDQLVLILQSCTEKNKTDMVQFFEMFEFQFLSMLKGKEITIDFFKIYTLLKLYRNSIKGSDSFFFTLESLIQENINEIKMDNLTFLLMHYANNQNEKLEVRNKMLNLFEQAYLKLIRFLNPAELIAVLYCYVKVGLGSSLLFRALEERVVLVIDQMTITDIKKLLVIAANSSKTPLRTAIYKAVEMYIRKNIDKIHRSHLPDIFLAFCENSRAGSQEFFTTIENKLVDYAFNMEPSALARCCWGFALLYGIKAELFTKKARETALTKLKDFSAKDLATMVWSLSRISQTVAQNSIKSKEEQQKEEEFFVAVEDEIETRFDKLTAKDCAHLVWGYIQNQHLRVSTVDKLKEIVIKQKFQLDTWDVATIAWGYSKFEESYDTTKLYQALEDVCLYSFGKDQQSQQKQPGEGLIEEMSNSDIVQVLRGFVESQNETEQIIRILAKKCKDNILQLTYDEVIISMYSLLKMKKVQIDKELAEIIIALEKQSQEMKRVTIVNEEMKEKYRIQDEEFYKENEELEKILKQ